MSKYKKVKDLILEDAEKEDMSYWIDEVHRLRVENAELLKMLEPEFKPTKEELLELLTAFNKILTKSKDEQKCDCGVMQYCDKCRPIEKEKPTKKFSKWIKDNIDDIIEAIIKEYGDKEKKDDTRI